MTHSTERRERILEAAQRLFSHYGTTKTTIGDIAREVGIGVGSVYLEFCSKEAIVAELARDRRGRVVLAMERAMAQGSHSERLAAALEARIRALFEMASEGAHSCDLVLCRTGAKGPGRFSEEELAVVARIIEAGKVAGEFAGGDTATVVGSFAEAFTALSPPWVFGREESDCVTACRALSELLLAGLRLRATAIRRPGRR